MIWTWAAAHRRTLYGLTMVVKFIKETIFSACSGWHEGKGHKMTRNGDFSRALEHYNSALKYSTDDAREAGMLELIARTYARLGKYEDAITKAKMSLELFSKFKDKSALLDNSIHRNQEFIRLLNTKNADEIKDFIFI